MNEEKCNVCGKNIENNLNNSTLESILQDFDNTMIDDKEQKGCCIECILFGRMTFSQIDEESERGYFTSQYNNKNFVLQNNTNDYNAYIIINKSIHKYIEDSIFSLNNAWFYVFNDKGTITTTKNHWNKFMLKSKNKNLLLKIMSNEITNGNFKQGKVDSDSSPNKKYYSSNMLMLYGDYNKKTLDYLKNKYGENKEILWIGHKEYSKEEIKRRVLEMNRRGEQ